MRRWCAGESRPVGAVLSLEQGWRLARAWFADRLAPAWRRRTPDEAQGVFAGLGLDAPFWRLSG